MVQVGDEHDVGVDLGGTGPPTPPADEVRHPVGEQRVGEQVQALLTQGDRGVAQPGDQRPADFSCSSYCWRTAGMYGIRSIPTLVIYRDGIPVFGQPGAIPGNVLEDLIDQVRGLDMPAVRQQYEEQLKSAGR